MAILEEVVLVKDGGRMRAVRVVISATKLEELNVQALAQEAWGKRDKKLVWGDVVVRVEKFGR